MGDPVSRKSTRGRSVYEEVAWRLRDGESRQRILGQEKEKLKTPPLPHPCEWGRGRALRQPCSPSRPPPKGVPLGRNTLQGKKNLDPVDRPSRPPTPSLPLPLGRGQHERSGARPGWGLSGNAWPTRRVSLLHRGFTGPKTCPKQLMNPHGTRRRCTVSLK